MGNLGVDYGAAKAHTKDKYLLIADAIALCAILTLLLVADDDQG